jgi:replicative DNA helicase
MDHAFGPIVPGRVYVLGARPSCGKTLFLMNLLTRIRRAVYDGTVGARPWKVLACFSERSRRVALWSLAALEWGYDENLVLQGAWNQLPERAQERVQQTYAQLQEDWVVEVPDFVWPTMPEVQRLVGQVVPEILVVDYLQLIQPNPRQTEWAAWVGAMRWFRQLATEGMTVIVASQLKRKGDGAFDKYRPPFLEDFLGGGMIEAAAEVALGFWRPLKPMTRGEREGVRDGGPLDQWKMPGVMAVKCLKHTYIGDAADHLVRLRVGPGRVLQPYRSEDEDVPF